MGRGVGLAVHVLNRSRNVKLKPGKTPYELWHGKKRGLKHLKVFGTEVYFHVPKEKLKKLDEKCNQGIFVGYDEEVKAYRIWDPEKKVIVKSRDVVFKDEFAKNVKITEKEDGEAIFRYTLDEPLVAEEVEPPAENRVDQPEENAAENPIADEDVTSDEESFNDALEDFEEHLDNLGEEDPERLNNFGRYNMRRNPAKFTHPKFADQILYLLYTQIDEPIQFKEAINCSDASKWQRAMMDEMKAHKKNQT